MQNPSESRESLVLGVLTTVYKLLHFVCCEVPLLSSNDGWQLYVQGRLIQSAISCDLVENSQTQIAHFLNQYYQLP